MSKTGTKHSLRNNGFILLVSSIMSDDLPEPKDNYSTPGRSTPPPTTSYSVAKPDTLQLLPAGDATNEQPKPDKNEKDDLDISSPDENPGYKPDTNTNGQNKNKNDSSDGRGGGDNNESKLNKMNGLDKLDGQWINKDTKPNSKENEDDSCAVNCIYYTLQCCECTIS